MSIVPAVAPTQPTTPRDVRPAAPPPRSPPASAYSGRLAYDDYVRKVERTKVGLLLLAIGAFLSWIPLILLIGALLTIIGAILVALGRRAFGDRHAILVVVSVVIVFSIFVTSILLGFAIGFRIALAFQSQDMIGLRAAVLALFNATVVLAAFAGVANVLIAHELESQAGRYLLYAGLALVLAVSVAALVAVTDSLATLGPGATAVEILNTSQAFAAYALLQAIPSIVFAAAYLLAYSRVSRGDIPERVEPVPKGPTGPWSGAPAPAPSPTEVPGTPSSPQERESPREL